VENNKNENKNKIIKKLNIYNVIYYSYNVWINNDDTIRYDTIRYDTMQQNRDRDTLFSPRIIKGKQHSQSQHRKEVETQTQSEEPEELDRCGICFDTPTKNRNITFTQCGHVFCTTCILKSLQTLNSCPICRSELEPARKKILEPLNATVTAEIIQNEERDIDIHRRIAIIEAFTDGKREAILSLCREFAFGTAHSIAGWQGTSDETYHESWREYEYNNYDNDDDDDDDDDGDDDETEIDDNESENGNTHDDDNSRNSDANNREGIDNVDASNSSRNANNISQRVSVDELTERCVSQVQQTLAHEHARMFDELRRRVYEDSENLLLASRPSAHEQVLRQLLITLLYGCMYYIVFTIATSI